MTQTSLSEGEWNWSEVDPKSRCIRRRDTANSYFKTLALDEQTVLVVTSEKKV
jgi:hypothetical protein